MGLEARKLSLSYGDGDAINYAVREVSLAFEANGFYGVMGPSGSGKSSLLYMLAGLKQPTSGSVLFDGRDLTEMKESELSAVRRLHFGFVFQQPFLLSYLTARENIAIAARPGDMEANKKAEALMEDLGLSRLANRTPVHLSGGERQRVVVARAMINEPGIIFADEPTAALDHKNGFAVMELLKRYRSRGKVIVVTHDPAMLTGADTIIHLEDGVVSA
jgi:putative ABC transport system ATP-binding protein